MKLAILGAGMIVKDFLQMVADIPSIDLKALLSSERSLEKNQKLAQEYNIGTVYTDLDTLLDETNIDTVYVALPNHLHYEYSKQSLLAGKHVICEKPFTLKSSELEELVAIATDKQLILIEAITNQYLANYRQLKEDIDHLGEIRLIECNYSQYSSRYDVFKAGQILPAFNPKMGGGALMDINVYNIHLVVGLFGRPESVTYYANVQKDIDTSGMLILQYLDKIAVCIGSKDTSAPIKSTIQGRDGSIIINGPTNTLKSYTTVERDKTESHTELTTHPHRMYEEFVEFERIISQLDFKASQERLDHSLNVMTVLDQALESANLKLG
ncbi:Gfo/Idh/MocA family protein [Aerococcaceae bacterium WGS1372]